MRFRPGKNKYLNEKGFALVTVILILFLISLLGFSLVTFSINNMKMSTAERDFQSVYYIAEAGANYAYYNKIEPLIIPAYTTANNQNEFFNKLEQLMLTPSPTELAELHFEKVFGETPSVVIEIIKKNNSNPRDYMIKSTGIIGERTRTVEQDFSIHWKPKNTINIPENTAVFVKTKLHLTGSGKIIGNAGVILDAANTIYMDGGSKIENGLFYVPYGAENIALNIPDWKEDSIPAPVGIKMSVTEFELPAFPAFPDYPMIENEKIITGYNSYEVIKNGDLRIDNWLTDNYTLNLDGNIAINEIKISSNYTLNINTGNSDKSIVVDKIDIPQGHIRIIGQGNLTIYVRDNINLGGGSTINEASKIDKLKMYLQGTSNPNKQKEVKFGGDQKIYGSLFAEDANIEINGSGGFQGHIFTGGKNFIISGGARIYPSLLYAPLADFTISGGGSVVGSIISKTLTISGGGVAKFNEISYETLPFTPGSGGISPNEMITKGSIREI